MWRRWWRAPGEEDDPGIVTVVPAAPQQQALGSGAVAGSRGGTPLPQLLGSRTSSRQGDRGGSRPLTPADDPLLLHLRQLQAQGAGLDAAIGGTAPRGGATPRLAGAGDGTATAGAADPESLLADVATAQQLCSDTQRLSGALASLLLGWQAWHGEQLAALVANQEYINRTLGAAEAKADKAVRHVQQQAVKLRALSAGLSKAAPLAELAARLAADTEALEAQQAALEARAAALEQAQSQQQR